MCIICVDYQKELITSFEARRILTEMVVSMDDKHVTEVIKMIEEKENESRRKNKMQSKKGGV